MGVTGQQHPDTLRSNNVVGVMGYTWLPETDVMKVNAPPIIIGKKRKGSFTSGTVW